MRSDDENTATDQAKPEPVTLDDIDEELGDLPIELADDAGAPVPAPAGEAIKVSAQNARMGSSASEPPRVRPFEAAKVKRHEDNWKRTPNVTGTGAIHCKTFHCKLSGESMDYLDAQINEWLDEHPQYEVKFVTTSTGEWGGKMGTETHLVVQVWV